MIFNKELSNSSAWYKDGIMKSNAWKRFASYAEDFMIRRFPEIRNMITAQRNVRQQIPFDNWKKMPS